MRRTAMWAILAGIIVLVVALTWGGPYIRSRQGAPASASDNPAVGTAGHEETRDRGDSEAAVHDLETITGTVDPHAMIGERVDMHVRVNDIANSTSFWAGSRDNRVLVVLGRDNRNDAQRDLGQPSANAIAPVKAGQTARIIGRIEKIPPAEARFSWGLNDPQHDALDGQEVYIRAESVSPE
jgi:hypothetical protein